MRKKTIEILLKANVKFHDYGFYKRNWYDHATDWDTSILLVMPETALEKDATGQYLPVRQVDSSGKVAAADADGAAGFDALASRASTARGKRVRLAIFRPDSGRIFLTGPRTLYAETIRSDHARIQKLEICVDQWNKRYRESESTCKHSKNCRRPEACMLGIRVMKFPVITGTLLPLWAKLQRCLQKRWEQSRTIELWKKSPAGGKEGAKPPKPPLRVVHLVHDGKPVLGLCLPHGIADITIRTLMGETKLEDDEAESAAAARTGAGFDGGASSLLPTTKRAQLAARRMALLAAYEEQRQSSSRPQSTDPFPPWDQNREDEEMRDDAANPSGAPGGFAGRTPPPPPIVSAAAMPPPACKLCSLRVVLNTSGLCARCAQKLAEPYAPAPYPFSSAPAPYPQRVSPLPSTVPAPRPVYAPAPRAFLPGLVIAPPKGFISNGTTTTTALPVAKPKTPAPAAQPVRVGHVCAQCGKANARPCTGCNAIHYCTRECQVAHWVRCHWCRDCVCSHCCIHNRPPPHKFSFQPKHKPLCPAGKKSNTEKI